MKLIDSHIHFDQYDQSMRETILRDMERYHIEALISVSKDIRSAEQNLQLHKFDPRIKVAVGYHPEQSLPTNEELEKLYTIIRKNKETIVGIGEVGLPYYLRRKNPKLDLAPYLEILESFIHIAKELDQPIILHAIYEDAYPVVTLLKKYQVDRAHFHWFKGDSFTLQTILKEGYYVSVTPDVLYEKEIEAIVSETPLEQLFVETDGPWPFKGPFTGEVTHPKMMHETVRKISQIKALSLEQTYRQIYYNTKQFYRL